MEDTPMTDGTRSSGPHIRVFARLPHSWCGASVDAVDEVAAAAEVLGFDGVSVQDHVLAGPGVAPCGHAHAGDDRMVMESLTTLAWVAGRTSRVQLLTGVLVLPFRHLMWVAKMGATIDLVSGGRFILGVGIGAPRNRQTDGVQNMGPHSAISARETALFDLLGNRGRLMDEALEALHRLWTEDAASFVGEQVRFEGVDLYPKPVQRPRPPIWVGGRAEAAIRRAATLADGWFPSQASVRVLAEGREVARRLAAEAGRPEPVFGVNMFAVVDRDGEAARAAVRDGLGHRFRSEDGLLGATIAGTPDEVVARMLEYVSAGCSVFDLKFLPHRGSDSVRQMELLSRDVLPAVRDRAAVGTT
jgi:alkanesulfonate monooxygenase SsuD/methylene tetrahydromethanopterin reductase-like flavin-dependent oxidoreductase (luciferase family)